MGEPCSALDPIATAKIEELSDELRANFSIVIVTHSMQQAAPTEEIFTNPQNERTRDYITGRFG